MHWGHWRPPRKMLCWNAGGAFQALEGLVGMEASAAGIEALVGVVMMGAPWSILWKRLDNELVRVLMFIVFGWQTSWWPVNMDCESILKLGDGTSWAALRWLASFPSQGPSPLGNGLSVLGGIEMNGFMGRKVEIGSGMGFCPSNHIKCFDLHFCHTVTIMWGRNCWNLSARWQRSFGHNCRLWLWVKGVNSWPSVPMVTFLDIGWLEPYYPILQCVNVPWVPCILACFFSSPEQRHMLHCQGRLYLSLIMNMY